MATVPEVKNRKIDTRNMSGKTKIDVGSLSIEEIQRLASELEARQRALAEKAREELKSAADKADFDGFTAFVAYHGESAVEKINELITLASERRQKAGFLTGVKLVVKRIGRGRPAKTE